MPFRRLLVPLLAAVALIVALGAFRRTPATPPPVSPSSANARPVSAAPLVELPRLEMAELTVVSESIDEAPALAPEEMPSPTEWPGECGCGITPDHAPESIVPANP